DEDDDEDECMMPRRITGESMAAGSRRDLYLAGGVIFITTRLLVVDMLTKRVPFESLSGIVVANAHRVIKVCYVRDHPCFGGLIYDSYNSYTHMSMVNG